MNKYRSEVSALGFIALMLVMGITMFLIVNPREASANPSQFTETTQTASATTTPTFLYPASATTTLVYDSFRASTGNNYANNQMELLTQFTASSTVSQLNINLEYSNGFPGVDCVTTPGICDWYEDTITNPNFGYSTTTLPVILSMIPVYQWKFASSTVAGVIQPNNRATRAIAVNVPVRYIRAVFTCSGAGCGVWAQFVPAKETK